MNIKVVEIGKSNLKIADGNYSAKYPRSEEFISEGIPFIRGNNFENKTISDNDMYFISPDKHSELKKGHVKPKDVLITTRGNIGKVALVPERHDDSNINAQIVLLRCNEGWHPEYLLHAFNSDFVTRQIPSLTTGTALKQLPVKSLKKLKIPLPPIEQQKKIAAILDAADTYRQKTKALITKYDALTQSLFLDMFGDPVRNPMNWEVKSLGNLTNLVTDGKHGNCNDEIDSGYYFVSAKNIKNNKINFEESRQIPKEEFEEVDKRTNLQAGDLVMINTGATIGRMAIAENIPETRRCTFQKSVAIIKVKPEYLTSVFLMYVFELRLASFASKGSGSAIKNLLLSAMKRFKIIIPPIDLQTQFAERVKVIEVQKTQAEASLVQADNLFNSLLQRAFKGELV